MRTKVFLWTLVGCLVAPSLASAQDIYFSMGNQIQKIAGSGSPSLVHTAARPVGDLALCAGDPDQSPITAGRQYLYYVEHDSVGGDRISRLDINTALGKKASVNTSAQQIFPATLVDGFGGTIGEIRLTTRCDVLFASSTGAFQVSGRPAFTELDSETSVNASTGSGLATAFDGTLRFSAAFTPTGIVGLGVANGGEGSANGTFFDRGDVCGSSSNKLLCKHKSAAGPLSTPLAVFNVGDTALFFEFVTNDDAVAATSKNPTTAIGGQGVSYNGILWKKSAAGLQELFRSPKVNGNYAPIVGVAVGPSNSELTAAPANATDVYNVQFGPVGFDVVTPTACKLQFRLKQYSWAQAQAKLDDAETPGKTLLLDPGLGGESWIDAVEVIKFQGNCGLNGPAFANVGIQQFNAAFANKAVLRCHAECEVITSGWFPYFAVDDGRGGGGADDFSEFLTANTVSSTNQITFSNPLSNAAVVQGPITAAAIANATTHNATGGLSIRFQICANSACSQFLAAEPPDSTVPIESGAGLSISALNPDGTPLADCEGTDQGSSTPDLPQFRTSGTGHNFNLNTPLGDLPISTGAAATACSMSDKPNGYEQLFVATVFSNSGKFQLTSILFKLRK